MTIADAVKGADGKRALGMRQGRSLARLQEHDIGREFEPSHNWPQVGTIGEQQPQPRMLDQHAKPVASVHLIDPRRDIWAQRSGERLAEHSPADHHHAAGPGTKLEPETERAKVASRQRTRELGALSGHDDEGPS